MDGESLWKLKSIAMKAYQIFGSENSVDIDVMFFVEEIPQNIDACRALCMKLAEEFAQKQQVEKKINANIAKIENGCIVQIFKGMIDESNNALFYTYNIHNQLFDNQIHQLLPRNIDAKLVRTYRVLLSFLTKTTERVQVKAALRGDFSLKLAALQKIELHHYETEDSLGNTVSIPDFQKTFAFQIGQTIALLEGKELFTKNEIAAYFPDLQPYLNRNLGESHQVLQKYLSQLNELSQKRLPFMTQLYEVS